MRANPLKSCAGFTFVGALVIVILIGIMMGAIGQSWQMTLQREREEELLFRGSQIRDAIGRWRKPPPGMTVSTPLQDLKDLLEDPRSAQKVHYLRRLYKDPITNKDFAVIRDPVQGITGVASTSTDPPLKRANFPVELKEFGNKDKYSDWQFVYKAGGKSAAGLPQTGQSPLISLPPVPPPPTSP
ncbi:MAG TPA: type II secretion system protein [Geobacteraceae bacterium]|nr:type II secretion system protein [Geobacteraceae bacterium]